jgi:hypothetical protein
MKALYESAGATLPELVTTPGDEPEAEGKGAESATPEATPAPAVKSNPLESANAHEVIKMEKDELLKLLDERDAQKAADAAKKAEADEVEALRKENEALKAAAAKANRLPGGAPHQARYAETYKYDNLSTAELGMVVDIQNELHAKAPTKMAAVSEGAMKALMLKVARIEQDKVSPETAMYAKAALKAQIGDLSDEAIKTTADVMYTGGSSHLGEDWVGTAYSNQLWENIRAAAAIVAKFPTALIPDGYNQNYFPMEDGDPTWYKVPEASVSDDTAKIPLPTIPASYITTSDNTISVGKMGARCLYTGEMTEDSLIAWVPNLRRQLEASGAEQMEHAVIDGDDTTTGSTNINDIGNSSAQTSTNLYLICNGLRHVGLSNGRSAGGSLSEDDYIDTIKLIGANGVGTDPTKVFLLIDPNVYFKSLKLATLKTKDVFTQATIESGTLTRMWNYPLFTSWFMHYKSDARKANNAGKVDQTTTDNNAYGAIVAVRPDQWKLAYKRRMTMETTRIANADAWEIVALTRWGFKNRDAYAAAETYYVGV